MKGEITLGDLLRKAAERYPDRPAIIYREEVIPYQKLQEMVNRIANGLIRIGVKPGDRIGLIMKKSPQWVVSWVAAAKCGAIPVPLNHKVVSQELVPIFKNIQPRVLILEEDFFPLLKELSPGLPDKLLILGEKTGKYLNWQEILENGSPREPEIQSNPEDILTIQITSGTTATPKGVMFTHNSMISLFEALSRHFGLTSDDVWLNLFPSFFVVVHTTVWPILLGIPSIIIEPPRPDKILEAISKYRVTYVGLVPAFLESIINYPELNQYNLKSLKFIYCGAAKVSRELASQVQAKLGLPIFNFYATTEASTIAMNPVSGPFKENSPGPAFLHKQIKIIDDNGKSLPPGEIGEIVVRTDDPRGCGFMKGYWNLPEETVEKMREGWLYTGDVGRLDEDSYLYILGRKTEMINVGGVKIYPPEVEEFLNSHPKVQEAVLVGKPDKLRGEIPVVFITKKDPALSEKEILNYCQGKLAPYKIPKEIKFLESFPKTGSGKVQKQELKKYY